MSSQAPENEKIDEKIGFLSHKAKDGELAKQIANALTTVLRRVPVFLSEHISPSDDWRKVITKNLNRADFFILLFTDPDDDWSWCLFEAGYVARNDFSGNDRPIYCIHPHDVEPPSPLAHLQTISARPPDVKAWIAKLCSDLRRKTPSDRSMTAAARKIVNAVNGRSSMHESLVKPHIEITPRWPKNARPNWSCPRLLPKLSFEDALVTIDDESAHKLELLDAPRDEQLLSFLQQLDDEKTADRGGEPAYWIRRFFDSLDDALHNRLYFQEIAFFRVASGRILRPIIVSVARSKDGAKCSCRVIFAAAVNTPSTDNPTPIQRLADAVRLCVRARLEIVDPFLGQMAHFHRNGEDLDHHHPVVQRLQTIMEEAKIVGFRPDKPAMTLFSNRRDQRRYENLRSEGLHLWRQLERTVKQEEKDGTGEYPRSEQLLCRLKAITNQYLQIALPGLRALTEEDDHKVAERATIATPGEARGPHQGVAAAIPPVVQPLSTRDLRVS